jgi:hypothetical protein
LDGGGGLETLICCDAMPGTTSTDRASVHTDARRQPVLRARAEQPARIGSRQCTEAVARYLSG